jgi:predicted nucleic acid-binding protein
MAARRTKRVYWDSAVYIDRLERTAGKIEVLEAITQAAESGRIVILASALVLAEVAKPEKASDKAEAEKLKKLEELWENEFFVVQVVDRSIALRAAEIVREHGLKPADAIHVATAIALGAHELQTYDAKVLAKDGKIGHPPLAIKKPSHPDPMPLFDPPEGEAAEDEEPSTESLESELADDD